MMKNRPEELYEMLGERETDTEAFLKQSLDFLTPPLVSQGRAYFKTEC